MNIRKVSQPLLVIPLLVIISATPAWSQEGEADPNRGECSALKDYFEKKLNAVGMARRIYGGTMITCKQKAASCAARQIPQAVCTGSCAAYSDEFDPLYDEEAQFAAANTICITKPGCVPGCKAQLASKLGALQHKWDKKNVPENIASLACPRTPLARLKAGIRDYFLPGLAISSACQEAQLVLKRANPNPN